MHGNIARGKMRYELHAYQTPGHFPEHTGRLFGDEILLWELYRLNDALQLKLESGETITFGITKLELGSAAIFANDRLPGIDYLPI